MIPIQRLPLLTHPTIRKGHLRLSSHLLELTYPFNVVAFLPLDIFAVSFHSHFLLSSGCCTYVYVTGRVLLSVLWPLTLATGRRCLGLNLSTRINFSSSSPPLHWLFAVLNRFVSFSSC